MKQKLFRLIFALSLFAPAFAPALPALADSASITLSSNTSSVASGGSVVVIVRMNGGGNAVNAVEADLSYPASQLQYVGFSATGSAFEIGASSGGGDGTATLDRGTTGSVSGSGLVGTVTFRALVSSGSASVNVAGSSSLVAGGTAIPYASSGVTIHFGASSKSSTSAAPTAPAAPKDTSAPTISAMKVTDLTPYSATVTWVTDEASSSSVDFGVDTNYGLTTSSTTLATTHSVALTSSFLLPQTLLHYHVKSADAAGNVATSPDQTFQLPGVPVTIIVRGANGQPQAGVEVSLGSVSGTTDSHGRVTLASALGNQKIVTTYQGVTIQKPITVSKSDKPLPPVQLDLSKRPLNGWMLTSFGLIVIVLTLLGLDAFLFGSRFFRRATGLHRLQPVFAAPAPKPTATPAPVPAATEPPKVEPAAPASESIPIHIAVKAADQPKLKKHNTPPVV
jgi:hypothetical protein